MRLLDNIKIRVKSFLNPTSFSGLTNSKYSFFGDWDISQGKRIDDGKLLDQGFVTNAHVYSINRLIASKGSVIPIDTFEGETIKDSGDAWDVVNPLHQSKEDFIEQSLLSINSTGDLFYYAPEVNTLDGSATVLQIWNAGGTTINIRSNGEIKDYSYNNGFTTLDNVPPEDVLHIKLHDPTQFGLKSKRGLSPLQAAYAILTASNNAQTANAAMLKNGGVKGIISSGGNGESLGGIKPKEEVEIKNTIADKLGRPDNFNSVHVTRANIDYTSIGSNPSDLQILESNLVYLRDLCNVYGAPSQLFNDSGNKTYNNQKAGEKAFLENAVIPVTNKILREITRFVKNRGVNWGYKLNTEGLLVLQEDKKIEAEKDKIVSETIINILSAPISNESKLVAVSVSTDLTEDEINELLPEIEEGTGANENTGGNVQVQSLNGAQVSSMLQVTVSVSDGTLPKPSAVSILVASFGMSQPEAAAIINPITVKPPVEPVNNNNGNQQ